MPLPLIVGIGAAIAAATGAGAGIHGAVKMKKANDMQKEAQDRHSQNEVRLKRDNEKASEEMNKSIIVQSLKILLIRNLNFPNTTEKN